MKKGVFFSVFLVLPCVHALSQRADDGCDFSLRTESKGTFVAGFETGDGEAQLTESGQCRFDRRRLSIESA